MDVGDIDLLLVGTLLRLVEVSVAIYANNDVANDLGVEVADMTRFVDQEDPFDQRNDLVGGRLEGLSRLGTLYLSYLRRGTLEGEAKKGRGM